MSQRKLKRQLSLAQLIMLGTAGTIAAEIFVLTGHAAGLVGPATVLALAVAGILNYSIALNYCELATMFPVTGGGVTYVRQAWGLGILAFLVGSLDVLASSFYAALSAVGFAYSLQLFFPSIPIVATALIAIAIFTVLNILDVTNIGKLQIVLGSVLLACLVAYMVAGFLLPGGFSWQTFSAGTFFIGRTVPANLLTIMRTIALVFAAYVGYEVIAHDAEEAQDPSRNIPRAILISVTMCMVIYVTVAFVTLGTVPWQTLAGSETALSDAVVRFAPSWGVPMMAVAGIIATLTSVNAAMLSGTREAFTEGRVGMWPRAFSSLSRFRTPWVAAIFMGVTSGLVAAVGLVDFLSYVTSAGFLFVLFFSNLAMIRLRKTRPDMPRPFKVPLFPLTPVIAVASCFLIIINTSALALRFGAGVLATVAVFYYTYRPIVRMVTEHSRRLEASRDRIVVPVANVKSAQPLAHLAALLAEASEDTSICLLSVVTEGQDESGSAMPERPSPRMDLRRRAMIKRFADEVKVDYPQHYYKVRAAPSVAQGILDEVSGNVKLVLMGWPGVLTPAELANHPVKQVLQHARSHVAVLLDRGFTDIKHILVPVGGGFHSRLAIRLAYEIGLKHQAQITAIRVICEACDPEQMEDYMLQLRESIEESIGRVPPQFATRVIHADDVLDGVLVESKRVQYDLMVVGASDAWLSRTRLFGALTDELAEEITCSVLLTRRYQAAAIAWIRRQTRAIPVIGTQPERVTATPAALTTINRTLGESHALSSANRVL
jgi:amino acid transporter/nucleotide-binding universal stress UspA family protein